MSPATTAAVRLTGATKTFGDALVLDGIDLEVAPGEFLCLLGASGCGKSTLLNLLAGLDRPSSGQVSSGAGRPALMFQDHALFPWLTAGRNVELALQLAGTADRAERRAEAARLLGLVRLGDAYGKRVHTLSGGMRQRVALARALAQGSDLLLMDEPFAALDALTRDVLHEVLIGVWERRRPSVVFVTHDIREAVRLGTRVVLLSSRPGRIAREWRVGIPHPRRAEDATLLGLAREISRDLREEVCRHARD
ncbi:ABC transporter ATP-binding protein [Streptomyces benahoarensis]|uniref:ABC transporter ATP-binding protein n=1 Tax=Streptomyces benahoarensis TaxID=2595054 RepID=A0A553ZQA7_9ACTN|nr:ABC transporter ATP-binding protein [Streptomyces benahoarensis]TSB31527.1 ABC transporter ATP-binding protein [Streptomyces benahoarensis]TSB43649.1 ABC transporter ATP-binding protein [Streptomyces benahoarensis]